jgi:hypothetical protein
MGVPKDIMRGGQLPAVRRAARTPSCPAWVESRLAFLKYDHQSDSIGKYRSVPTLPATQMLSQVERDELESYKKQIGDLCTFIPEDAEKCMLVIVTEMMLVLAAVRQNETSVEARGEAYLAVLDDIPPWAVIAAKRRWYRGECGKNDQGQPYDCRWMPAPCDLRRVALIELDRVRGDARVANELLRAECLIEYSEEYRGAMSRRLNDLVSELKASLVGRDGSGDGVDEQSANGATVGPDQSANPA